MNKKPNCQDGGSPDCTGEAIMMAPFESGNKYVCGPCFLKAKKDSADLRYKEALRQILKEEGKI